MAHVKNPGGPRPLPPTLASRSAGAVSRLVRAQPRSQEARRALEPVRAEPPGTSAPGEARNGGGPPGQEGGPPGQGGETRGQGGADRRADAPLAPPTREASRPLAFQAPRSVFQLFSERQANRLDALRAIDPRLAAPLERFTMVPLSASDKKHCAQAVELTARAFAGEGARPENLSLLSGVSLDDLRDFFREAVPGMLSDPAAPSVVLLDGRGDVAAAVLGQLIDPSQPDEQPLPPGPLGEVFRVLAALDEGGFRAAEARGLLGEGGPRWANLLTVAKRASLPGNLGALAQSIGVTPPEGRQRESLKLIVDLFDAALVHTTSRLGPEVCFTVETVSPGSTRVLEAQNAEPLWVGGQKFSWTPVHERSLGDLFRDSGAQVSEARLLEHPEWTRDALEHRAQFWCGRAGGLPELPAKR